MTKNKNSASSRQPHTKNTPETPDYPQKQSSQRQVRVSHVSPKHPRPKTLDILSRGGLRVGCGCTFCVMCKSPRFQDATAPKRRVFIPTDTRGCASKLRPSEWTGWENKTYPRFDGSSSQVHVPRHLVWTVFVSWLRFVPRTPRELSPRLDTSCTKQNLSASHPVTKC